MSEENLNGAPAPTPAAHQQDLLNQITPPIRAAIQVVARGIMTGFPGVPEHVLLQLCCFEMAFFAGQALSGDLVTMIRLRTAFKKSFDDGMSKAPMQQLKGDWAPPAGENIRGENT